MVSNLSMVLDFFLLYIMVDNLNIADEKALLGLTW